VHWVRKVNYCVRACTTLQRYLSKAYGDVAFAAAAVVHVLSFRWNFELLILYLYRLRQETSKKNFCFIRCCFLALLPAIRSLERRAMYLFYCMFLFAFSSTISRQPAGRNTPNFACGRTLVPDVSCPLLGASGPRGGGKGGNVECEWRVCVSSTDALY